MDAAPESKIHDGPLVGREEELSVLRHAIVAARAGRGRLVVVEGGPGSGKTRLVLEAAAEARCQGLRVVALADSTDRASTLVEAALDDAARGRAVVIVDDRDGIGNDRSAWVVSLAGSLSEQPVLVLMTRTGPSVRTGHSSWDLESELHATWLRIGPLRPGAVFALAARMSTGASMPVLERLHAATGGNALLVVETLAALGLVEATDPEPWPLSDRAVRRIRLIVDALSPDERDLIEVASVLGEECQVGLLGRVIGSVDRVGARTAIAESAFMMSPNGGERCRFVPPLARELVYASLSPDRRATVHARIAAVLAAEGTSPAVLAHRSLAASAVGDVRRGEHYLSRLLREHARADTPASPGRWPYFLREAEHWAIGYGDRAIRLNHRMGLLYVARLLSRPGVEFAALALGERRVRRSEAAPQEPTLAAERARVRVTRRIRDAIEHIARAHAELGAHLEHAIRTGTHCTYAVDPATGPSWEVRSEPSHRGARDASGFIVPP